MADEEEREEPEIFVREDAEELGDKAGPLTVCRQAREHWSDKNSKKFTPDTALKIIEYVGGSGCCLETAAAAAGINKVTLHEWLRKAERGEGTEELRAWKRQLDEAEHMIEMRAAQGIMAAGQTDWKAWAWFLERRFPKRWGRKDTTMHANPDGSPLAPPAIEVLFAKPPSSEEEAMNDVGTEPAKG